MLEKIIIISTDFITLGQLLKLANVISSGAEAKYYLASNEVLVNDIYENRRGKKLYSGDKVTFVKDNLTITLKK